MKDLERSFDFRGQRIRTVRIDGEPWFAAVDVCRVLGLDPSLSVTGRRSKNYADGLDDDVSIHAPARGATHVHGIDDPVITVSIHAPARGATPAQ